MTIFLCFFLLNVKGQKAIFKSYTAGRPANDTEYINSPYVRLKLFKDGSYLLIPYAVDCWSSHTLEGKYQFKKDSLILIFEQFYPEFQCKFIDTFHRHSWHTLKYYDKETKLNSKYTFLFEKDTTQTRIFPLSYADTIIPSREKRFVADTFYLPKDLQELNRIKFYKPKRKKAPTEYISFKVESNQELIPNENYLYLIKPFKSLSLK